MMTNEQFEEILSLKHEIPGVEFKCSGPRSDDYHLAKIVRAVMGMANRRGGGIVIIGVEERNGVLNPKGLSQTDLDSWRNNDHVITALANYMNPPANFDRSIREFQGNEFVVLEVHEFADIPIICKKKFQRNHRSGHHDLVLREGACYIRNRHKPETVEVITTEHMRELLDLAIEKGVVKFVTHAQRAGMSLSGVAQPDDAELFNKQLSDWTTSLVDMSLIEKIQSRGYWRTIIRPDRFSQDKINYSDLYSLVQNTSVDIFGGGFPNVIEEPPSKGLDCVGQEIEKGYFLEIWRLYQSGQFIHYADILDDWFSISNNLQPGKQLTIGEVIRQFTGIFVFASHLALADVYAEDTYVVIDVLLKGLQGRQLIFSRPGRSHYEAQIPEYPYTGRFQKDELIARSKELALQASREVFSRFGWNPAQAILEDIQSTFKLL